MYDVFLSRNFRLSEFMASAAAKRNGIYNIAQWEDIERLRALCVNVCQPVRDALGFPIFISSGFRCKQLNDIVGGVPNSQHLDGSAADLYVADEAERHKIFEFIKANLTFDQVIREHRASNPNNWWIHVSYVSGGRNRRQVIESLTKRE